MTEKKLGTPNNYIIPVPFQCDGTMTPGFTERNILAEEEKYLKLEHMFFLKYHLEYYLQPLSLKLQKVESCLTTLIVNDNLKNDQTQYWHKILFQEL